MLSRLILSEDVDRILSIQSIAHQTMCRFKLCAAIILRSDVPLKNAHGLQERSGHRPLTFGLVGWSEDKRETRDLISESWSSSRG